MGFREHSKIRRRKVHICHISAQVTQNLVVPGTEEGILKEDEDDDSDEDEDN